MAAEKTELKDSSRPEFWSGAVCRYFLGFGVGFGSLLGVSQQGFFSILPLALHLYVPSFCFTHIVSFGSAARAVVATASTIRPGSNFICEPYPKVCLFKPTTPLESESAKALRSKTQ